MTNSRSLSWIDRARLAALLAKVTDGPTAAPRPAPRPRPEASPRPRPAAGPATRPLPVPVRPPVAAPRTAPSGHMPTVPTVPTVPTLTLPPVRPPAPPTVPPPAPPPPAAPAKPSYTPFSSTSRNLEERLQALVAWIDGNVVCRAAFIADDNGLPVVEHLGPEPGHIAAASSILVMLASVRSLMREGGGWLSLALGSSVLNVVEVATRWGRFGIGVVTDEALPREFLTALSAAVERAFQGESPQGDPT